MKKLIFLLLLIGFPLKVIQSSPLEEYLWRNRVLVTFSPTKNNTERINLLNSINKKLCDFNSRNIILFDLVYSEKNQEIKKFESYFENLALNPSEFLLILIGKDGSIKLNSKKTSLKEIFSLIDTMPMRQEEMLNDKC